MRVLLIDDNPYITHVLSEKQRRLNRQIGSYWESNLSKKMFFPEDNETSAVATMPTIAAAETAAAPSAATAAIVFYDVFR